MAKGDIQNLGERPGQERLAAAGRADEEDIALLDLNVAMVLIAQREPFVVIVNGHGEELLGALLPDHVLIEFFLDVARRRNMREKRLGDAAAAFFLIDDRLA
jgi:hypothetical protein